MCITDEFRARVFEGLTFVMSGLVPLTSDLMRYFNSVSVQELYDWHLLKYTIEFLGANCTVKYRTEIAMSAHSFGADIQTK